VRRHVLADGEPTKHRVNISEKTKRPYSLPAGDHQMSGPGASGFPAADAPG